MAERAAHELIVAGGGIVGLAVAWQARAAGAEVTLLERDRTGEGTSRVAAGMLAPVAEAEFGGAGRRLLELGLRSAELWPGFAAQLSAASGVEVELRQTGTLLLARDADESLELDRQLDFRRSLGLPVERLRGSEARRLEPALAPTLRGALDVPGDHAVDPRRVLTALRRACERAGVRVREHASVRRLLVRGPRVDGVELDDGDRVMARSVVLATGAWSGSLEGLPEPVPIRPVKGQIMRLRDPAGPGLLQRVIRFEGGYVVPRGDGRYVLGATVEERGFELAPTAGGVYELLREARELVPGVTELEIEELSVGLRPGTPDNLPMIGHSGLGGLLWAAGHHRNGVLLAPLTAQLLLALLQAGPEPEGELLEACDPRRFARGTAPAPRALEVRA
ncbi:MAG: glycine oxidase ThiO [Solirubrobacteraceae bacterium]